MGIFGPRGPEAIGVKTFGPAPALHAQTQRRALEDLLLAASAAEKAEHELAALKAFYRRSPSPETLNRLLMAAADTLEKEIAFDELWEQVSQDWF